MGSGFRRGALDGASSDGHLRNQRACFFGARPFFAPAVGAAPFFVNAP